MPAGVARRNQRDCDIALAVEGACKTDLAVIEDDDVNICCFSPTDALQMHGKGRAGRPQSTSSGNAVDLTQKLPVCFSPPSESACAPPRSLGTAKLNWA